MTTKTSKDKPQKKIDTLTSLSTYKQDVEKMSQGEFAYHINNYQYKMNIELYWLAHIFNKRFNENSLSFMEVVELASSSELGVADAKRDEKLYPKIPFSIFLYMQDFWDKELTDLQDTWKVDPLDLAIMAVEEQESSMHQAGWVYHILKSVLGDLHDRAGYEALIDEAREVIDDGDSVKVPQQFGQLLTINLTMFKNKMRIDDEIDHELRSVNVNVYQENHKSATAKLKKGLTSLKSKKSTAKTIAVELTADELSVLTAKSMEHYLKTKKKAALAAI